MTSTLAQNDQLSLCLMAGATPDALRLIEAIPEGHVSEVVLTTDKLGMTPLHRVLSGNFLSVWRALETHLDWRMLPDDLVRWQLALPRQETTDAFDQWLAAQPVDDARKRDWTRHACLVADGARFKHLLAWGGSEWRWDLLRSTLLPYMMRAGEAAKTLADWKEKNEDVNGDAVDETETPNLDIALYGIDYGDKLKQLADASGARETVSIQHVVQRLQDLERVLTSISRKNVEHDTRHMLSWREMDLAKALDTIVATYPETPDRHTFSTLFNAANTFFQAGTSKQTRWAPPNTSGYQALTTLERMRDWMQTYRTGVSLPVVIAHYLPYIDILEIPFDQVDALARFCAWACDHPEMCEMTCTTDEAFKRICHHMINHANKHLDRSTNTLRFLDTFLEQPMGVSEQAEAALIEHVRNKMSQDAISEKLEKAIERRILKRASKEAMLNTQPDEASDQDQAPRSPQASSSQDQEQDALLKRSAAIGL